MTNSSIRTLGSLFMLVAAAGTHAACIDDVVMVHGNGGSPSDFNGTYSALRSAGWAANQIHRPAWGSAICIACNDHRGSEETPVENALIDAIAASCTGRIDVIGHSMGVTLAARQIDRLGLTTYVDSFVGVAGAYRGLWSCGSYPWSVPTTTCGYWGLSVGSPLVNSLANRKPGARAYSIKSWIDQVVCSTGVCTVGGVHSSTVPGENASYIFATGHFGLLTGTASTQVNLIR